MTKYLPLILFGVFLNAFGQIALKKGMINVGHFTFSTENIVPVALAAFTNVFILLGLLCYVVSVVVWMLVLSRVDVSFAYPFLSVGYVLTAVLGYALFNEDLTAYRIAGIALICIGVSVLARSGATV